jgi:hypothetical protein
MNAVRSSSVIVMPSPTRAGVSKEILASARRRVCEALP